MNRHFFSYTLCALLSFALVGVGRLSAAASADRLVNISSRTGVGTDANVMIAGFVVGGGTPKKVLIRAVGPGLGQFNLGGLLADPVLELHDANSVIATNDNWSSTDATAMSDAGAFALTPGSKDAALVATLNPGAYTAIVSGVNRTSGLALVEVYDLSGTARLINISTRAQVGTGASILISGMVVGSAPGTRHVLIRAAGPALAPAPFNVAGTLADPTLTLLSGNTVLATNDNWSSGDATATAALTAAMAQAGAFPFTMGSKDAALLVDLPSGPYTIQVSGVNNTSGVALLECYDLTSGAATSSSVSVSAAVATTAATLSTPAAVTFSRTGDVSSSLTINYSMAGTAQPGTDYTGPTGSVVIPAGQAEATVYITALNSAPSGTKTAIVNINPPSGYLVGSNGAQVTLYYGPGSLYLSNMRAAAAATTSSAYGTATIQLGADERFASVNVSFSNLSSPQTVAYLRLSQAGEDGAYLIKLPNGQLSSIDWNITATGTYSAADIVAAIKAGKVYLDVETTAYPAGELRGTFLASTGSQTFTAPPAPPSLPAGAPTPQDAARFLTQATFGPTKAEIDALVTKGFSTWITEQMALTPSLHRDATNADFTAFNTDATVTRAGASNRQAAWWKIAVTGPDQLRQRVAFALSEILVTSDANGTIANWEEGAANYYDLLVTGAFGNFRTLLENVTLSPIMGVYLSHLRNSKATATTEPDENYAREVMQLFTIGLNQLQPDGTLKLSSSGLPIPTYDQTTITETAKVFTGWQFNNPNPTTGNFRSGGGAASDYLLPMTLNPNFHENAAKTIVGGVQLPANQGGLKDLKDELDTLFNHPNTGPFICRELIQRLVTSNPGPGYVYRVSQVFANNGNGVRGDLGAVVRAILTDYEARSPQLAANQSFGKLKEPLLRNTALFRAFAAAADNGRYNISNPENNLAQAALRSPTVFNFFEPNYVVPGAIASAGLYAPEYQILTDTTAISAPNAYYSYINATRSATTIGLTYTGLPPTTPATTLVDYLNLVLCAGSMPTATRDRIATALTSMPASTTDTDKYRSAIYLTVTTQSAAVQK